MIHLQDFPGYAVTHDGKVYSLNYRKQKGVVSELQGRPIKGGYLSVALWKDNKKHECLIHRLIAEIFIPNPENKPEVNHKDGDKAYNHYANLEWVTPSENMQHAVDNGLRPTTQRQRDAWKKINANMSAKQRSRMTMRKLVDREVREIRQRYKDENISQRLLAKQYVTSQRVVSGIVNYKLYAEV